jgi:hypothetical protein
LTKQAAESDCGLRDRPVITAAMAKAGVMAFERYRGGVGDPYDPDPKGLRLFLASIYRAMDQECPCRTHSGSDDD